MVLWPGNKSQSWGFGKQGSFQVHGSNQLKLLRSGSGEMPYGVQFCYFLGHCYSKRVLSPCLFTDKSHFPVEQCGLLKPGLLPPLVSCAPPKAISSPVFSSISWTLLLHIMFFLVSWLQCLPQHHRVEIYCLPMFLFSLKYAFNYDSVCLALCHTLLFF